MAVAIRTESLSKRYGSAKALGSLDLEVAAGEVFGYLGPNGAGKSTTTALLLGFIRATAGRAEIFGLDVRRDAARLHGRIGYVPGGAALWPSLTGAETLRFLANIHGTVGAKYHYVALAPAEDASWPALAVYTLTAAVLALIAVVAFDHRDLATE